MTTSSPPTNALAWFEIAVSDLAKGADFYQTVLGVKMPQMEMGGQTIRVFGYDDSDNTHVSGNIYQCEIAPNPQGTLVHLNVAEKLETAIEHVLKKGGQLVSDIIPIPEGRFIYIKDPDGNGVALFERGTT